MHTLIAAAFMVLLLNACGLKGPLYLPQEPVAPQPPQPLDNEKKK